MQKIEKPYSNVFEVLPSLSFAFIIHKDVNILTLDSLPKDQITQFNEFGVLASSSSEKRYYPKYVNIVTFQYPELALVHPSYRNKSWLNSNFSRKSNHFV